MATRLHHVSIAAAGLMRDGIEVMNPLTAVARLAE
jgi:hypothetical protein